MARKVPIRRKDGTRTSYFWSNKEGVDRKRATVYKQKTSGVARMNGVVYNAETNRFEKVV